MFELKSALKLEKNQISAPYQEEMFKALKPDFMYEKDKMTQSALLEFSILKIINRIAKLGKDLKEVYNTWDSDKNGFCK